MRRERRLTKRERQVAAYEDALAAGMEKALTRTKLPKKVRIDMETGSLTGRTMPQVIPRMDVERAKSLLAAFYREYPELAEFSLKPGDQLSYTDVDSVGHTTLVVDSLRGADYASAEYRALATRAAGLSIHAIADLAQKRIDESSQEEALREEVLPLGWEESFISGKRYGCLYGESSCQTKAEAHGQEPKLRRARWYDSFPIQRLAQEHLRAAAAVPRAETESGRLWQRVIEHKTTSMNPYL